MHEITISNITQRDFEKKQIRILTHQKELFPPERNGFPETYEVTIVWGNNSYGCTYTIGSKDGRGRSGILRLKEGLAEVVGRRVGGVLALRRINKNSYHLLAVGT